ncbi:MAG: hypothetical protein ABIS47_01210, partial [Acidimicrobiales bacterium]
GGVGAAVVLGAAVVRAPGLYALVVPAVISVGVLWAVLRWTATDEGDVHVARWTYGSYGLHLALSMIIGASGLTVTFFGGDANTYHIYSVALARHWSEGTSMPQLPAGKEGFFYALARLYEIVGPYRVAGLALTALCSALLVPLLADTTRRLFGARARLTVLPLVVLLPGFLIWTSQLLREAPIVAFLALGANLAVRLSEQFRPGRLAVLGLTVAVLFTLRANVAYVFGAGLLVGLALGGRHLIAGVATAAAMMGLVAALVLGGGLGESGYQRSATADLGKVNTVRSNLASTANSGIGKEADVSTASGSIAYLPIGLPQLLLGPLPWQVHNLRQVLGLLEAMTVWWLVPAFVRGIRRGGRRIGRRAALLLAPAAFITLVLTLLIGNVGTLVRERIQVTVFLLPFVALGWRRAEDAKGELVESDEASAVTA